MKAKPRGLEYTRSDSAPSQGTEIGGGLPDELITFRAASMLTRIPPSVLRRLARDGLLETVVVDGSRRLRRESIEGLMGRSRAVIR